MPDSTLHPSGSSPVRIATRGSALALAQANQVQSESRARFPGWTFELEVIRTTGDQWQEASLAGGHLAKGLFTKELETALLEHQADLAVHSLKDLPTTLPEGLVLGGVSRRVDARDVLVVRSDPGSARPPLEGPVLENRRWLPEGAVLATNSTRRSAQALSARPDLQVVPIRGNVGTRLRKLSENREWTCTLLAAAGLLRLQYRIDSNGTLRGPDVPEGLLAVPLSIEEMIPCVGQAALGFETRREDSRMREVCRALTHADTECCTMAERAFLRAMGGGCQTAVAGHARMEEASLIMDVVSYLTGAPVRATGQGARSEAEALGRDMAARVAFPAR